MTHKVVKISPGDHYTSTDVPFDRSLSQIEKMLIKHKCSRIGVQKDMRGTLPAVTLAFEKDGLPYIIEFPIIHLVRKNDPGQIRMDISGRIIHDRVKSLLIEVDMNVLDFSQGMMPFLMLRDSVGKPQAMQDYVLENRSQIIQGTIDIGHQLSDGR